MSTEGQILEFPKRRQEQDAPQAAAADAARDGEVVELFPDGEPLPQVDTERLEALLAFYSVAARSADYVPRLAARRMRAK